MSRHACHHPSCEMPVPPRLLACPPHWYQLPRQIRAEIWRTYRPGQERDKRPSQAYLDAVRAARECWTAEGVRT